MSDHDINDEGFESQPPSLAKPKVQQKITSATFAAKYNSSKCRLMPLTIFLFIDRARSLPLPLGRYGHISTALQPSHYVSLLTLY